MKLLTLSLSVLALCAAAFVQAWPGEPAPLLPQDLLQEAKNASPAIAEILRELSVPGDVESADLYEKRVLSRVEVLLKAEDPRVGAWAAEKSLRAALRFSRSQRQASEAPEDAGTALETQLFDKLVAVRRRLLALLMTEQDLAPALKWADVWLPLYAPESPLGDDVRALWVRQAQQQLKAGDTAGARIWLDRIDATFSQSPEADPLRKDLLGRAAALLKESTDLPDAKALGHLQQAQVLWPRLSGLHDEIARRKQTYQVLHVAVRDLPEYLSPALAWSDSERQAVELIFESLVEAQHDFKLGPHYRPVLAERLVSGTGLRRPLLLRRDAYWSDGDQFTAADVRHTVQLLTQAGQLGGAAWRDLLEPPRLDSRFGLDVVYRQGLLDPWGPLCFKVLPQHAHGKPLARADDVDFAKQPIGTGPYQHQGRSGVDGRVSVVLRANPQHVRLGMPSPGPIREIRFFAWKDAGAEFGKLPPHLVLDPLPGQVAALKKQGYTDFRNMPVPRVWYLALNHRRAPFANEHVRLALAHAIDRQGLLNRHFTSELPGTPPLTVNGPFQRGSWANSPVQRVPEELFVVETARAAARKASKDLAKADWTLKYLDGDPRLDAAFKELAEQVAKLLAPADVKIAIHPVPLAPRDLQKAVRERDFDLVYHHLDLPDSPHTLAALFDSGGRNFLGYEDGKLQNFLGSALHHRDFAAVRGFMQDVHHHLHRTMPLIPLWQLPYPVAVHGKLRATDLDPLAVFGNVAEWKLAP